MVETSFEKTNPVWQWQQLWRQVGEWLEVVLRNFNLPIDQDPMLDIVPWLKVLLWGLLLLVVCLVSWRFYKLIRFYGVRWQGSVLGSRSSPSPTEPPKTANKWLKQALVYQNQGNYREACRALYLAMLQRLDEKKLVPQQASRTDGEYDRLVKTLPHSHPCHTLITTHERLCFSDSEISSQDFRACHQAYEELEAR